MTDEHARFLRISRPGFPPETRSRGRLLVTDEGEAFYWTAEGRGSSVVLSARISGVTPEKTRGGLMVLVAADGTRWECKPGGCGCGSPLKSFAARTAARDLLAAEVSA